MKRFMTVTVLVVVGLMLVGPAVPAAEAHGYSGGHSYWGGVGRGFGYGLGGGLGFGLGYGIAAGAYAPYYYPPAYYQYYYPPTVVYAQPQTVYVQPQAYPQQQVYTQQPVVQQPPAQVAPQVSPQTPVAPPPPPTPIQAAPQQGSVQAPVIVAPQASDPNTPPPPPTPIQAAPVQAAPMMTAPPVQTVVVDPSGGQIRMLSLGDDGQREKAAKELRKFNSPEVVGALMTALQRDGKSEVRQEAAKSLGELQARGAQPALRQAAREDTDGGVR